MGGQDRKTHVAPRRRWTGRTRRQAQVLSKTRARCIPLHTTPCSWLSFRVLGYIIRNEAGTWFAILCAKQHLTPLGSHAVPPSPLCARFPPPGPRARFSPSLHFFSPCLSSHRRRGLALARLPPSISTLPVSPPTVIVSTGKGKTR